MTLQESGHFNLVLTDRQCSAQVEIKVRRLVFIYYLMGKSMRYIIISLLFVVSSIALAGSEVDNYLMALKTMDEQSAKIMLAYRKYIRSECGRDITEDELNEFAGRSEYDSLSAQITMNPDMTPDYQSKFSGIPCK